MKVFPFKISLILIAIFSGCAFVKTRDRSQKAFNFSISYGTCHTQIINTEDMTFTRKATIKGDVTIPLIMSEAQIDSVCKIMDKINFYSLKPEIRGDGIPDAHYTFHVKNGSVEKIVKYVTAVNYKDINNENKTELDILIDYILNIVISTQKYKQLPGWNSGC
ncbi:MAG: hypothetical protein V4642_10890 [Bacteroidota bacterium]